VLTNHIHILPHVIIIMASYRMIKWGRLQAAVGVSHVIVLLA